MIHIEIVIFGPPACSPLVNNTNVPCKLTSVSVQKAALIQSETVQRYLGSTQDVDEAEEVDFS